MPLRSLTAPRRSLVLYLAAVVGPTLVVLSLGAVAARRQMEALEGLRVTNERLQETSIGAALEEAVTAQATSALSDPTLDIVISAARSGDPATIDRARRQVDVFRRRHRIASDVFVMSQGELRYPAVAPAWPHDPRHWFEGEPASVRPALERALTRARAFESGDATARAVETYGRIEHLATTTRIQGLAAASAARVLENAGESAAAAAAYRRLFDRFGDVYSLADRPYALLAAQGLCRLHQAMDARVGTARTQLIDGRWTLTPDQVDYFLADLPSRATEPHGSPFLDGLAVARSLSAQLRPVSDAAPGRVRPASIGDGTGLVQVLYRSTDAPDEVTGIVLDLRWVADVLLPRTARPLAPDRNVRLGPSSGQGAALRTLVPGWSVSLIATTGRSPRWLRADFVAFVVTTVVVLGVLVMGVLVLARDIQRETALNQLRADLVGGVSHELKAPLSVIRVYAETMDGTPDASEEEQRRFATAIVQETERLRRLVDGVIDFSKIQQGQRSYAMVPGSLGPVIGRTVERFRDYLVVHGFTLDVSIPDELPSVRFDEVAVDQAVLNLLDNAFKYSGDSTRLAVRVLASGPSLVVEVQDHGIGIAAADQTRIFDRFHRGKHPDRGGYGLGLYLVRHIMDAHGGTVEVKSVEGEGSTFSLVFPVTDANALAPARTGSRPATPATAVGGTLEVPHVEGPAGRG